MKKSVIVATTALALAISAFAPAHAQYGYNRGYYNNNGWNTAAAAAGGALVGALVGAALTPAPVYVPPPVYVAPPVYAPPPVSYQVPLASQVPPGYYVPGRACQTVRIPQYDQYGRLVQYVQTCAN